MLQGLRSAIHNVTDIGAAKKWYSEVLEIEPYFDSPEYVGFNIGGFELGLFKGEKPGESTGGVTVYWGVEDIHFALQKLLEAGAALHHDVVDVGGDILMASVLDPFGNVLGIIRNPHFEII